MSGYPQERLEEAGRSFVTAVLNSQRHIAIFAREEKNLAPGDFHRIGEMRRTFDTKLVKLLDEGVAAGEFAIADTGVAALAIGGMVNGAYVWYRPGGRLTLLQASEGLTALILNLAGAADAKPAKTTRPARAKPAAKRGPSVN